MAGRINTEKITLGLGTLEIGTYTNGVFGAYRDLGAIRGTATLTLTRERQQFLSGRPLQVLKTEVTTERVQFKAQMFELSVANIKDALGAGSITSSVVPAFVDGTTVAPKGDLSSSIVGLAASDVLTGGGLCGVATVAIRWTHLKDCATGLRTVTELFKAQAAGNLAVAYNETDWDSFEVEFEGIADLTRASGAQLYQIIDERAPVI